MQQSPMNRSKMYDKVVRINPFPPSVPRWDRLAKISISI